MKLKLVIILAMAFLAGCQPIERPVGFVTAKSTAPTDTVTPTYTPTATNTPTPTQSPGGKR